eukprot:3454657-Amphidinium_carterae.1
MLIKVLVLAVEAEDDGERRVNTSAAKIQHFDFTAAATSALKVGVAHATDRRVSIALEVSTLVAMMSVGNLDTLPARLSTQSNIPDEAARLHMDY